MGGGAGLGVRCVQPFVAALYSQVSFSKPAFEMPPKRTTRPFAESNEIPANSRPEGRRELVWHQVFAPGSYSQVSPRYAPSYPPKSTTRSCVESYTITGPSRMPGEEDGFSFPQSVESFNSCNVAGAPVPMTSTPFNVPALKSTSVSHVFVAALTPGQLSNNPVKPIMASRRTTTARVQDDRDILLNLL